MIGSDFHWKKYVTISRGIDLHVSVTLYQFVEDVGMLIQLIISYYTSENVKQLRVNVESLRGS